MKVKTKTFHITHKSELDGEAYQGTFTTKKMTIGDVSRVGVIKAQLADGMPHDALTGRGVDRTTGMIHEMIAHCAVALSQKPEWFDPEELIDPELLEKVYREVLAFENSFRPSRTGGEGNDGSSEDSSGQESSGEGGATSSNQDLVDKKVPQITQIG